MTCKCIDKPAVEDVMSYGGEVLVRICVVCHRPRHAPCPVCKNDFRGLGAHLRTSQCREHYKMKRFWGTDWYSRERGEYRSTLAWLQEGMFP
jgi:hypothetical protein